MAAKKPEPDEPPVYEMPKAEAGRTVLWYHYKGAAPMPALVSQGGNRAITLSVVSPNSAVFIIRTGVRHVTDPQSNNPDATDNGLWDYTVEKKELDQLHADITQLRKELGINGTKTGG